MLSNTEDKLIRIGVFYDGSYFSRVSQYYRYYDRKARISIKGLHDFIRDKVAEAENADIRHCQLIDAHYFRGRYSAYEAAKRDNQLLYDRIFDDILMYAGVVTHYLPIFPDKLKVNQKKEKGIDVWYALEAFELTMLKQFSVVVLITGDGDYLPLVKKINTLGSRVMLLHWNLDFPFETGLSPIRANANLISEVNYELSMGEYMHSENNDPIIENMFIAVDEEEDFSKKFTVTETSGTGVNHEMQAGDGSLNTGHVIHIDFERGIGNIASLDGQFPNIIFFRNQTEEFAELERGFYVSFSLGQNAKGPMAVRVKSMEGDEEGYVYSTDEEELES